MRQLQGFLYCGHSECPVVLRCCLLTIVTKFHNTFANLKQVDSPNNQDKFQICCTDMYLVQFQVNFVVFCVFL